MHLNVKHWYETLSLSNSRARDAFTATSSPPCWSCVTTPTLCLTSWAGGTTEVRRLLDSCCSCGGRRRRSCRSAETSMEGSQVSGVLISLFWHFKPSVVFLHLIYLPILLLTLRSPEAPPQSSPAGRCQAVVSCWRAESSSAGAIREPAVKDLLHLLQNW